MKKLFSLLIVVGLLITVNQSLAAQEKSVARKLFYGELFGPGVVMSINYDSRINSNARLGLGYRIGVGYGFEKFDDKFVEILFKNGIVNDFHKGVMGTFYSFPVGLNYVIGKPKNASAFEVGAGVTFLTQKVSMYNWEMEKPGNVIGSLNFMYRLMPVNGGVSIRIGFTPIIGTAGDLFPMGAVSFGYAF